MVVKEVPEDWKKSSAIPIFRKADREIYRPVRLTSHSGKVMEHIVETISKYTKDMAMRNQQGLKRRNI